MQLYQSFADLLQGGGAVVPDFDPRPAFAAAENGDSEWMPAATAHAATPEGHREISELLAVSEMLGDIERQDQLQAALLRGELAAAERTRRSPQTHTRAVAVDNKHLQVVADDFGVALDQVRRDHAISHILSAISESNVASNFTFYGGTALSRTLLPRLRLSEDIDLLSHAYRVATARDIESSIEAKLARTHGEVTWEPRLSETRGAESAVLRLRSGVVIRVQMMNASDVAAWPTVQMELVQRYPDARPANLSVFTPASFAAAKTVAWADRRASRDLYDLWALALLGAIDASAALAFRKHGTGTQPGEWMFTQAPSEDQWTTALAHQGRIRVGPKNALRVVKQHWSVLLQA